jgi:hypothetical protein
MPHEKTFFSAVYH